MQEKLEKSVLRYKAEPVLFSLHPSRLALSTIDLPIASNYKRINVWRNHALEPLIPLMDPYCRYGRWAAIYQLGPYDDTLTFDSYSSADVELLWLDSTRFRRSSYRAWLEWLESRMRDLRRISNSPIVLATWSDSENDSAKLRKLVDSFPDAYFGDLESACAEADVKLVDTRSAHMAGTPISRNAQTVIARELACHWLPAAIFPQIKAIAIDLDQTLHEGILGEDGTEGVYLTPGHADLQNFIKSLRNRGVYIALVSRNERVDVEALFHRREDYVLRWEDFSAIEVSWGEKATALKRVATSLRIAPDSMLFVDDNTGELADISMRLPDVQTALAHEDAFLTRRVIQFFPGVWRWKRFTEDEKRVQDLQANAHREALAASSSSPEEYFRSLQVTLTFRNQPRDLLTRVADLCNKTNQFNLALRRFNQVEIAEHLNREDACVTTVELADRFLESGVIAVIVAEREGDILLVEELCISCRALGRRLEDAIILQGLRRMAHFDDLREVRFRVCHGPRNQPALDWLRRLLGKSENPAPGLHPVPASRLREFAANDGISLETR